MAPHDAAQGEVHTRRQTGELVVDPDKLHDFLRRKDLMPPHAGHGGSTTDVEIRTATPAQNPPHGAVWLTAVEADVSLKADPAEVLRVLHEAGILDALREEGRLPFL